MSGEAATSSPLTFRMRVRAAFLVHAGSLALLVAAAWIRHEPVLWIFACFTAPLPLYYRFLMAAEVPPTARLQRLVILGPSLCVAAGAAIMAAFALLGLLD